MKFFRSLFASRKRTPTRAQRRHRLRVALARKPLRPLFERLEERRVLATVVWDGGAGTGNWADALNWDSDTLPTSADDVVIPDLAGAAIIDISGGFTAQALTLTTLDSIDVGSLSGLQVGLTTLIGGTLDVIATNNVQLGTATIGGGTWTGARVTGNITNTGNLLISSLFPSALNYDTITNQGSLSLDSNSGSINGTFINSLGGTMAINGTASFGGSITNQGTLTVNAVVTANLNNSGTIEVLTGAGDFQGAIAQITGNTLTGGAWISDGGDLILPAGTNIEVNQGILVYRSSTHQIVGVNLQSNQGTVIVEGTGAPNSTGGTFNNSGALFVRDNGSYTVSVDFTNSSGSLVLEDSGAIFTDLGAGTGDINVTGGTVSGTGQLFGNVHIGSGAVLAPGNSPGILNIAGNLTLNAGSITNIEVGGVNVATPDFDQFIVTGTATLDGTLNVTLLNNFLPDKSETFASSNPRAARVILQPRIYRDATDRIS